MKLSLSTEWLFFHLWKKNPDTNQSCPGVFVADTIIYRWSQPYFWYFTAKDGQILRKTKERIFVEQIDDIFMRSDDIMALYLQSQQNKIVFEYFQKPEFPTFLHQREKALNALLQKFIEPKNQRNAMIKVSWSPQFCLLSRKTNINDLHNTKVPIEERVVTFEGPEHLSIADSIASPILSADIEQICLNIVKHIQDVSGGNIQISRMVLFFKIDEKNRLWLLFSSGVKVRQKFINEDTLGEMSKPKDRIMSPIMTLQPQPKVGMPTRFQFNSQGYVSENSIQCNNCSAGGDLYALAIGQYVAAYEQGILDEESKLIRAKMAKCPVQKSENENDYYVEASINIPGILLKIWGKMDVEKYHHLKSNPSFARINLKFCVECYLKFTTIHVENKAERDMKTTDKIRIWLPQNPKTQLIQDSHSLISSQKPSAVHQTPQTTIPKLRIPIVPKLALIPKADSTHLQQVQSAREYQGPSRRQAKRVYGNTYGVQLPTSNTITSLNTTRSTMTHSQRIANIQQLKELLQNENI